MDRQTPFRDIIPQEWTQAFKTLESEMESSGPDWVQLNQALEQVTSILSDFQPSRFPINPIHCVASCAPSIFKAFATAPDAECAGRVAELVFTFTCCSRIGVGPSAFWTNPFLQSSDFVQTVITTLEKFPLQYRLFELINAFAAECPVLFDNADLHKIYKAVIIVTSESDRFCCCLPAFCSSCNENNMSQQQCCTTNLLHC
jgi:hypothetical protein